MEDNRSNGITNEELSELLKVRRDKLQTLRAEGRDPFEL